MAVAARVRQLRLPSSAGLPQLLQAAHTRGEAVVVVVSPHRQLCEKGQCVEHPGGEGGADEVAAGHVQRSVGAVRAQQLWHQRLEAEVGTRPGPCGAKATTADNFKLKS